MVEINPNPQTAPHAAAKPRPRALGRGLESLLPATPPAPPPQPTALPVVLAAIEESPTRYLEVALIDDNPLQTRQSTDAQALEELRRSLADQGLLQPILVRPTGDGRYHVVGGQRRLMAARQLGWHKIQAFIKQVSEQDAFLHTISENLLREDLNAIEQAQAFAKLANTFAMPHDVIAQRTGKSREAVTNSIRLLRLPADLQQALIEKRITQGHAKALLGLPDAESMSAVGFRVLTQELSVRKTEEAVQHVLHGKPRPAEKPLPRVDPNVANAQVELQRALGLRVTIEDRNGRGRVIIDYSDLDDFEALMTAISSKR